MNKFLSIFKFELSRIVKNKAFIITSAILIAGAAIGGFIVSNQINQSFTNIDTEYDPNVEVHIDPEVLYVYSSDHLKEYFTMLESSKLYRIEFKDSEEDLKQAVISDGYNGFAAHDINNVTKYVANTSLMSDTSSLDHVLNEMYQMHLLKENGLNFEQIQTIQNSYVNIETINLGEDGVVGYGFVYVYNMLLYMTVVMFGGIVSSSVITEKTSKAMELLITSATSTQLVAGKVLAIGLSCILTLVSVIVSLVISVKVVMQPQVFTMIVELIGGIPYDVLLWAFFLFIFGFFSILFLFAGLSSFATKPEDANTVITPIMLLIVVIFILNMSTMNATGGLTGFMKFLSYVPIFSSFFLFTQYVMGSLTTLEIIIGIITTVGGAILLTLLAAKIYRAGTLYYGNSISLKQMFKALRNK